MAASRAIELDSLLCTVWIAVFSVLVTSSTFVKLLRRSYRVEREVSDVEVQRGSGLALISLSQVLTTLHE